MGLTIYYELQMPPRSAEGAVLEVLDKARSRAARMHFGEVSRLKELQTDDVFACRALMLPPDRYVMVPPKVGYTFEVWPGDGCESADFGFCRYPAVVQLPSRGRVRTGIAGGWRLRANCKTQYAAEFGWKHFLHCHRLVIALLDFFQTQRVKVRVNDEGRYWESRDEHKLRAVLTEYDGLAAALTGVASDTAEEVGLSSEAPITRRPDFERLEHEGRLALAKP